MNTGERTASRVVDLEELAAGIVSALPALDAFEQRLSLELYRLLSGGQPVPRALLAERLEAPVGTVGRILDAWPGVFWDSEQRVVGYWGLAIATAYASPHQLTIDGIKLSAWCAWDTLFLPHLLAKPAQVESKSPGVGHVVELVVTPARVEHAEPEDVHVSFLMPEAAGVQKDIVTTFCHFVHFFPSKTEGDAWATRHPGTFILSVDEAHAVAVRKNHAQYGELGLR